MSRFALAFTSPRLRGEADSRQQPRAGEGRRRSSAKGASTVRSAVDSPSPARAFPAPVGLSSQNRLMRTSDALG
jgi:hypothetical protein